MNRDETRMKLWTDVYIVTFTEGEHKRDIFNNVYADSDRPKTKADQAVKEFNEMFPDY